MLSVDYELNECTCKRFVLLSLGLMEGDGTEPHVHGNLAEAAAAASLR